MMKRTFLSIVVFCFSLLIVGCGKEPSQISCKSEQKEDDVSVVVEMLFKRNNKKNLVTSGQLIMSYDLSGITFGEASGEKLNHDDIGGVIDTMFSNVCLDVGDNYENCEVIETKNGADVVMTFDLTNLARTSAGKFHKNMSIEQIKSFIIGRNEELEMTCTTS